VGPHPMLVSGSLLRGLLPALYYRLQAPGFGGPSILKQGSLPPGDSLLTFREICDRLRTGVGSTAQGFSLAKLDTTTSSISSSAPAARLDLGVVSLVLVWAVLSAPSARRS
jgi:hypothetical protein